MRKSNSKLPEMLQMVDDLFMLNNHGVRIVLYELESIQSDVSLIQQGVYDGDLDEQLVREDTIKKLIGKIWFHFFGEV